MANGSKMQNMVNSLKYPYPIEFSLQVLTESRTTLLTLKTSEESAQHGLINWQSTSDPHLFTYWITNRRVWKSVLESLVTWLTASLEAGNWIPQPDSCRSTWPLTGSILSMHHVSLSDGMQKQLFPKSLTIRTRLQRSKALDSLLQTK